MKQGTSDRQHQHRPTNKIDTSPDETGGFGDFDGIFYFVYLLLFPEESVTNTNGRNSDRCKHWRECQKSSQAIFTANKQHCDHADERKQSDAGDRKQPIAKSFAGVVPMQNIWSGNQHAHVPGCETEKRQ